MRITSSTRSIIKQCIRKFAPDSELFLFGSRSNDRAKGGDIDLLVLTENKLPLTIICKMRRFILNQIGEQKIDIVNFPKSSNHPFKAIAMEKAVRL